MSGAGGLGAGYMLVGVTAVGGALGWWLGGMAGDQGIGTAIGLAVGLVVAITAVVIVYVRPMQASARDADYSHLSPKPDDDD